MAHFSLPLHHSHRPPVKGRGITVNPPNRFEQTHQERDTDSDEPPTLHAQTRLLPDHAKTLIRRNDSPDIGFDYSLNVYRGCEHGCVYCYARPTHETLGFSAGLDFETNILVKYDAPEILRRELQHPKWHGDVITMSSVTDCYQPLERTLELTRRCLKILAEFQNPITIITKNHLVTRDVDILQTLARANAVRVYISITTLRHDLVRVMEPRTSVPARRLDAIKTLTAAGIPTGVLVAPVIPGLTDEEIANIVTAAAQAGAVFADMTPIRLPYAVKDLFVSWLKDHFPDRAEKVLSRIRDMRGGKLNDPSFHSRMQGRGIFADQLNGLFRIACMKAGILSGPPLLSSNSFRRPCGQGSLF